MRRVAVGGVDGCRGGWVLVTTAASRGSRSTVEVLTSFAEVAGRVRAGALEAVGVDMPIGLPERGVRACDVEARRRLGRRGSSVFPTPARALLGSADHADAVRRGRRLDGRGISVQAFNLLAKIAAVDAEVDPALQPRLVEVHPESCFARLAGAPLATTKRSAAGRAERVSLLQPHFPDVARHLAERPPGAAPDDVLDAFAVAWTARRVRRGRAEHLGDRARDARGLVMEIVV